MTEKTYTIEVTETQLNNILQCPGDDHCGHTLIIRADPLPATADDIIEQLRRDLVAARAAYQGAQAWRAVYQKMAGAHPSTAALADESLRDWAAEIEQLASRVATLEANRGDR